jgi:flagellar biosynthesis component FlhA
MEFYNNKKQQVAQLKKDAKKNNIQAVILFLLLLVIPFLPIHVLGTLIVFVFVFASSIAFATIANEKTNEANQIKKRYSL